MVAGGRELIDTLWNVNTYIERLNMIETLELIDTLWNVNHIKRIYNRKHFRN